MVNAYLNILVIFVLMFLGYWLTFRQWFSNHTADVFSKLVLTIALPCNMFLTITDNFSRDQFVKLFSGMIVPLLSMLITFGISLLYERAFAVAPTRRGTFTTMFTCSNTIFIGLPINLAIFGEVSVPYVLLYYIVNTSFFWTIGVFMMAQDNPNIASAKIHFSLSAALKKILSPALLGFIIGLLWMLLEIPRPEALARLTGYLGSMTTPLSMFVIGIIIYFAGIKNLRFDKDIIGILIGRYLISPLVVWILIQWLPVPELMGKVFIIQSAMPIQNSVPMLTRTYNGDVEFAASTLTYTVLAYLFVVPVLLQLIF